LSSDVAISVLEKAMAEVAFMSPLDQQIPDFDVLQHKSEDLKDLYTLGRKLGEGQFGITYLCTEKATGLKYACKCIPKRKLISEEELENVGREIEVMYHLAGHPNIVAIKGAYEDATMVYLVMELCEGGELFDRIIERGTYTEAKAANLTRTIVGVVEACHNSGVVHRDLKPENFLFVSKHEDSVLKAADFGSSRFFEPGDVFTEIVGSPFYVAPEVLDRNYGPEADIWSAGVILYILLCGAPPFWAETVQGIFEEVVKGEPPSFAADPWPSISEGAKDLIRKMLHPDPVKRYTASEVLRHPWIREDGVAPNKPIGSLVQSRLKQFAAMNKLKKLAIRIIAEKLSEDEIAGLKEIFSDMDRDNDGAISFEELKEGLMKVGTTLKEAEIFDLMDAADVDQDGIIDYGEFLAATLSLNHIELEENLFAAFQYFDKDGSGHITMDEVLAVCREFNMEDVRIEDLIHEVDVDHDGTIDYKMFVTMMRKGNGGVGHQTLRCTLGITDVLTYDQ
jgi:calcium-dependent protein kinase